MEDNLATPQPPINASFHLFTFLASGLALSVFHLYVVPGNPGFYFDFWSFTLPRLVGITVAAVLFPAVVAAVIAGIGSLMKRRLEFMALFVLIFWICWILSVIVTIVLWARRVGR